MTRLVYFAWVRERIGRSEDDLVLPADVVTVSDLIEHLKTLGEEYAEALKFPQAVRVALDQELAERGDRIAGVREIGIFPPMTGG